MHCAEPSDSSRLRTLGARLLIVCAALLIFEAVLPRFEDWLAAFGSPRPHYAYSSADMLRLVARGAWLVGMAWMAGLLLLVADADAAGGPLDPRHAPGRAVRGTPRLAGSVLLRGAIAILPAMPAALGLAIAADPAQVAALPAAAGIGVPATRMLVVAGAAIALAAAAGLWARLAIVEPAALLDPAGHPVTASWARTGWGGRGWIAGLCLTGMAWLPVLIGTTIGTAVEIPATWPAGPGAGVAALIPRLAWAPYSLFYRSAPPTSAADWALAGLRWVYLAGYCHALARIWRRADRAGRTGGSDLAGR